MPTRDGGATWNLASIGPVVSLKIYEYSVQSITQKLYQLETLLADRSQ